MTTPHFIMIGAVVRSWTNPAGRKKPWYVPRHIPCHWPLWFAEVCPASPLNLPRARYQLQLDTRLPLPEIILRVTPVCDMLKLSQRTSGACAHLNTSLSWPSLLPAVPTAQHRLERNICTVDQPVTATHTPITLYHIPILISTLQHAPGTLNLGTK